MSNGFERDRGEFARGGKAIVVLPEQGVASRSTEARLEETAGLAAAIGLNVVDRVAFRVRAAQPKTLIGRGQVETLTAAVAMEEAQLVV
ncbi:MAG: GTPase HflX, partial [Sphingomonas sp.]|nr:GTPase HflX [Sphingomonas sp.]